MTPPNARRPAATGGLPAEPGIYSWWVTDPAALPAVPVRPIPGRDEWLLYVGIAPKDNRSRQTLRSRVAGNHMRGNIGGSTFRLSLTALLWRDQGWRPLWGGDRVQISREDNRALSEWQDQNLRVHWVVCPEPWRYEADLILQLQPPMNLADNKAHPFHSLLSAARGSLKQAALNPT